MVPSHPAESVRDALEPTRESIARARAALPQRWLSVLLVASLLAFGSVTWRILAKLDSGTRPRLRDSIIFEYHGWRIAHGDRLYLDLWEVKPPLAFEVPAVLALATGDVLVYHWLSVLATIAAGVGTVLLVGALLYEVTGDGRAAVVGGIALFVNPAFVWRAPIGFKAKYFVVGLGLLGVYLALRDRPGLAGGAASAAVGFWQLGLVFPVLTIVIAYRRAGRRGIGRAIAGLVAVGVVMLVPVAAWGALPAMVTETVLTPLLVSPQRPMPARIRYATRLIDLAIPIAVLSIYGLAAALRPPFREDGWWIPVGAGWFVLVVVLVDFDGPPDLIPLLVFIALGVGMIVGSRPHPAIEWLVVGMAVVSTLTLGTFGYFASLGIPDALGIPDIARAAPPYGRAERRALFWGGRAAETCRVFFGSTQAELVRTIDGRVAPVTCGRWQPVWEALTRAYGDPFPW